MHLMRRVILLALVLFGPVVSAYAASSFERTSRINHLRASISFTKSQIDLCQNKEIPAAEYDIEYKRRSFPSMVTAAQAELRRRQARLAKFESDLAGYESELRRLLADDQQAKDAETRQRELETQRRAEAAAQQRSREAQQRQAQESAARSVQSDLRAGQGTGSRRSPAVEMPAAASRSSSATSNYRGGSAYFGDSTPNVLRAFGELVGSRVDMSASLAGSGSYLSMNFGNEANTMPREAYIALVAQELRNKFGIVLDEQPDGSFYARLAGEPPAPTTSYSSGRRPERSPDASSTGSSSDDALIAAVRANAAREHALLELQARQRESELAMQRAAARPVIDFPLSSLGGPTSMPRPDPVSPAPSSLWGDAAPFAREVGRGTARAIFDDIVGQLRDPAKSPAAVSTTVRDALDDILGGATSSLSMRDGVDSNAMIGRQFIGRIKSVILRDTAAEEAVWDDIFDAFRKQ